VSPAVASVRLRSRLSMHLISMTLRTAVWLGLLVCSGSRYATAQAGVVGECPNSRQYEEIFYPHDLPMREDYDTGESKPALYRCVAQAELPGAPFVVVLFSERVPSSSPLETLHWVYIGLLKKRSDSLSVASRLEVTKRVPMYLDWPGRFSRMDGLVEGVLLPKGLTVVHAQLWSSLTGSGATNAGSDLFFRVRPDGHLSLMLDLAETSSFTRDVEDFTEKVSRIQLGFMGSDRRPTIFVEEQRTERKNGVEKSVTPPAGLYGLKGGRFVLVGHREGRAVARSIDKSLSLHRLPGTRMDEDEDAEGSREP
jgi:hypothetical protein